MKKYYMLVFLIAFLFVASSISAKVNTSKLLLFEKVIYIDPGHGGPDPGTLYKNIYEKDINLEISLKLKSILENEGAIVYLTRYGDYDLSNNNAYQRKKSDLNNRAKIINSSKADVYISIHLNSISSSTWRGAQVFYDDINSKNIILADIMQKQLQKDLKTDREVKEINNMLMNRKIHITGILIEAGFLSNSSDRYLLRQADYQYKICNSIKSGLINYFYR